MFSVRKKGGRIISRRKVKFCYEKPKGAGKNKQIKTNKRKRKNNLIFKLYIEIIRVIFLVFVQFLLKGNYFNGREK